MEFTLTDHRGNTVQPEDWLGRPTMVFFGFTWCPDVCPTTLSDISGWLEELGPAADRLNTVLLSVDPERDTPAVLADYLSNFDPRIIGLTGPLVEIERAAAGFRARFERVARGGRSSSLVPGKRGRPRGTSQVATEVEALIEEHLRLHYLKREQASLARVVMEIRLACTGEGLPPPARRLDAMDERDVMRARSGAKAARQKFAPVPGKNGAELPLEVVQIDLAGYGPGEPIW